MQSLLEYLKQLDLSELEAKIYLTLIESGPRRVRELAESVGLKRTTAYFYIDSLIKKGLIAEEVKGLGSVIVANPPQWLKYLVDKKVKTAKTLQEQYPTVIKTISTSFTKSQTPKVKTEIKYFKGIKNVQLLYEEAFRVKEIRSYVKLEETPTLSSDNVALFNSAFKKNKMLKMWEIIYDSPFSRRQAAKILSQNNKGYFYKFMPSNLKWNTSEDILIYNSKVVIINYKGEVSSIVLHSTDYYNNSRELFDFIWKMLPEPKS